MTAGKQLTQTPKSGSSQIAKRPKNKKHLPKSK
jgi:hypothetical protein